MLLMKSHVLERKKISVKIILKLGKFKGNIWLWNDRDKARHTKKALFLLNSNCEKTTYPSHNVHVYKWYVCKEN